MELRNILPNDAFSSLENLGKPRKTIGDGSLQKIGQERVTSLKTLISEIQFLINEREGLSQIILDETEKIKTDIENFLMSNKAVDAEDFKERNGLRQKQIEISELQLNEKVNCWRDVALLKKELRDRVKELSEKEERMDMLKEIMD